MAPFLKENQQLPDADAWRIRSQMAEQTLENTLNHPYVTLSPGCTET